MTEKSTDLPKHLKKDAENYCDDDKPCRLNASKASERFQEGHSAVYASQANETPIEAKRFIDERLRTPPVEAQIDDPAKAQAVRCGRLTTGVPSDGVQNHRTGSQPLDDSGSFLRYRRRVVRRHSGSKPMSWRGEYKESLVGIWDGWCFMLTPAVVVWLPFALCATVLWSLAALTMLVEEWCGWLDDYD